MRSARQVSGRCCQLCAANCWVAAGLLSREAARLSESFVLTIGVGDDFVMRLGVDSIENLRTGIVQTLHASRLPKVSALRCYCRDS